MAISAAAKSHHGQLSGDRVSALARSGPGLTEYFGNFAFGEVHADAARLDETPGLRTPAHGAAGDRLPVRRLRRHGPRVRLRVGSTRARLLAVLTVLVPFIGYPRTLNGLAALNDITGS